MFVDFQQLKERVSFAEAASMLGLVLKQSTNQLRGPCPVCKTAGERALVLTEGRGFYCFGSKTGGDVIALVAHIRNCAVKEAAQFLAEQTGVDAQPQRTAPESERSKGTQKPQLQSYFDKLEVDHPAVDAVGFSPEFAKLHRIGFAKAGILAGTVAIPFRDEHGTLLGFIGCIDVKLPPDFTPNVVALRKPA